MSESEFADVNAAYRAKGWQHVSCGQCLGTGQVAVYSWSDFEGPGDCPDCKGGGDLWISPKGRVCLYPGGPFSSGAAMTGPATIHHEAAHG